MIQSTEILLFQAALGVQDPCIISEIRLNEANHELPITILLKVLPFPVLNELNPVRYMIVQIVTGVFSTFLV